MGVPVTGVSSRRGCADISMATLPSGFDLSRLMDIFRFSDSMVLTVHSFPSNEGSTVMFWLRGSYSSLQPASPSFDQVHCGGSGMSLLGAASLLHHRNN